MASSQATYSKVLPTFWNDPDVKRKLTQLQKLLLLYYFTSPHMNMIGLYYLPLEYVEKEVGLPIGEITEWTHGILSKFVTYDSETEEILIHRTAKHNVGESVKVRDNRSVGMVRLLREAHSATLVRKFVDLYPEYPLDEFRQATRKSPSEAPSEPLASPSEAPREAIAVAVAVAVTEAVADTEQSDVLTNIEAAPRALEKPTEPRRHKPTAAQPIDGRVARAVLAPAIRTHLWLAEDNRTTPPAAIIQQDPRWTMGRDIDIALNFLESGEVRSLEELAGAISMTREVHSLPPELPVTMKFFNVSDRHDRMAMCVAAYRREGNGTVPQQGAA